MRSIRLLAAVLASLALAACASTTPGWTYAPAPSPTPIPSVEPSGSAAPSGSAGASAEPSASGEPSGSPAPSASGGGTAVEVTAQALAWTPTELTVPADTAFQVVFANQDATILHDFDIHEGDPAGPKLFESEPFTGVETRTLDVEPLPAGIYAFVCSVHPDMVGALTAE